MTEVQKTGKAVSFPGGLESIVYCKDKMTKIAKKEKSVIFQIHMFIVHTARHENFQSLIGFVVRNFMSRQS